MILTQIGIRNKKFVVGDIVKICLCVDGDMRDIVKRVLDVTDKSFLISTKGLNWGKKNYPTGVVWIKNWRGKHVNSKRLNKSEV